MHHCWQGNYFKCETHLELRNTSLHLTYYHSDLSLEGGNMSPLPHAVSRLSPPAKPHKIKS